MFKKIKILLIIGLLLGVFNRSVYAEDQSLYVESGNPIESISVSPIITSSSDSQDSSDIRQASSLKTEIDPVYEVKSEITTEIYNIDANQMEAVLIDSQEKIIEPQVEQTNVNGVTTLSIDPPSQLKPGKYTLEITDQIGTKIDQDFIWGVLAINSNKSVYSPGEIADFSIAVLNEQGAVVCDAGVDLEITDPDGKTTLLSTENNKITVNKSVCQSSQLTNTPDYEAQFLTSKSGIYKMKLIGKTGNGFYVITDNFEVKSDINFDIERISATRIYPLNTYSMAINIKVNQDFKGDIYEEIPNSFDIVNSEEFIVEIVDQNLKRIKWSADFKKGESYKLNYQYKAPVISPQFYLIGPLKLNNLTDLVYQEPRSWQIASDTPGEIRTKTVQFYVGQNGTAAGIAAGATWPATFSVYLPDAVSSSTTIKSAYIEFSFNSATVTAPSTITSGLKLSTIGTFTTQTYASANSGENDTLLYRSDVTTILKTDIQSANTYTYNFYSSVLGTAYKAANAKITITYDYYSNAPTQINTARFYGGMIGTTLVVGATAAFTLTQPSLPENTVSIYDAWAEITAETVSTSTVDETIRVKYDSDAYTNYYLDNAGGAGSQMVKLFHKKVITDASHVLSVGASAGYPLTLLGYEQFITYSFNYTDSTSLLTSQVFMIGSTTALTNTASVGFNRTINIPESSINWKSIYIVGSSHGEADAVSQIAAKIGATATSFTNTYTYDWNGETHGNFKILSNEINDLNTMTTGDNSVYVAWKLTSGNLASQYTYAVLTYAHAKSDKTVNASANFLVATNGKAYSNTVGITAPVTVNISGPTQNYRADLNFQGHTGATADGLVYLGISTTRPYNYNGSLEYLTLGLGHTFTSEVGGTGTYKITLGSNTAILKFADLNVNFQYYNPSPTVPSLILPSNGSIGVAQTPSFITLASDDNNDDLQYEVKICTDSGMTTSCQTFTAANIGWSGADVGTSSFSAGTTATYVLQVGNSLAKSTQYYWKTRAIDPDGSVAYSATQPTAYSFTTTSDPVAPNIPTLISPTTASTGQLLTPIFETVTTDANGDNLKYELKICTDSGMTTNCQTFDQTASNVGWSGQDIGTSAYSQGTTATYVLQIGNSLAENTTYYWKTRAKDYSGTNTWSSTQASAFSFTTNSKPTTPTLTLPTTSTTMVSLTPTLKTVATDPNSDSLQYKIELATNASFTGTTQTFDLSTSSTGWSGVNVGTSAYSSGTTAVYIIPVGSSLAASTTYYWRTYAKDPAGTNRWSTTQGTPFSFTTMTPKFNQSSFRWSDDTAGETHVGGGGGWFNIDWDYRTPIIVANSLSTTLTDFQVVTNIDTSQLIANGKVKSDCGDLRFVDSDGTTPINYWIRSGCNTADTQIVIKIPSIAASVGTTIYIYYGNSAATTTQSGVNTFEFFDDFNDTSLDTTNKWVTVNGGSYITESGGLLNIGGCGTFCTTVFGLNSKNYQIGDGIIEYRSIATQGGLDSNVQLSISARSTVNNIADVGLQSGSLDFLDSISQANQKHAIWTNGAASAYSGWGVTKNTQYTQKLIIDGNNITFNTYLDNFQTQQSSISYTASGINSNGYVGIHNYANRISKYDWITVRKSASAEPSTSLGTEIYKPLTWLAAENIGITEVAINSNLRLRLSIGSTGATDVIGLRLQIAPKGASTNCTDVSSGNFSDVPTTAGSSIAVMSTSPNFTNQEATTNQLTNSATTFIAGKMVKNPSNQTDDITLNMNEFTEIEYNFQMTSNAGSTTPYCLRVIDNGTTLSTYTQVAQLTMTTLESNDAPNAPYLPYVNNTTAQTGQQSPVYGLIDHTPAFSAVFDDPNTSNTVSSYQIEVGSDTDWTSAEIWDSTKTSIGTTCNENARCADIVYGGGTSLVDGSTYYWRIKYWDNTDISGSWSDIQQFSINSIPTVSNVVINSNNSINLSEGSTIPITWTATVTDTDTYQNLSSITGKLYRSGVGSSCALDNNNCYTDATCDLSACASNSCTATCSADLYFFTEATDTGSTFTSQYYQALIQATDLRTEIGSTISSSTSIEVNSISGFSIDTALVYGEVFAGSDTGSSNTVTTVTNTGNSLINLEITGDYMCTDYPSCSGFNIEPKNQQFNLNSFTYGSGTTLTTSPQVVNIGISKPTQSPSNSFRNLYWGIGIPSAQGLGTYQGATTILVY